MPTEVQLERLQAEAVQQDIEAVVLHYLPLVRVHYGKVPQADDALDIHVHIVNITQMLQNGEHCAICQRGMVGL